MTATIGLSMVNFQKHLGLSTDSRLDSVRCIVWVHRPINVPFIHLWKLCLKSNCKITNKTWTSPKSDQIGTPQAPKVYQIYRIWCLHIWLVFVLCVPLSKFPKSDLRFFGDSLEKLGNSFKALTPLYIRNCFLHLFICIIYVSVLSVKSFLRSLSFKGQVPKKLLFTKEMLSILKDLKILKILKNMLIVVFR